MNRKHLLIIFCVLFLVGYSSTTASNPPKENKSQPTPPVGQVVPIPEGCLSMEFFSSTDTSRYTRNEAGHISTVITPTDRSESLREQWSLQDFEKAIYDDGTRQDNHYVPGVTAWEYLKKSHQPGDEIWTFGVLDSGFVIIRDDKLFAMVVTNHSL